MNFIVNVCALITVLQIFYFIVSFNIKKIFLFDYFISTLVVSTGNLFIDIYFKSLLLFSFTNLIFSILDFTNFINFYGDYTLMFVFTVLHTVICICYGIYKIGIKKLFYNFYVVSSNSLASKIIGFFMFFLLVFIDLIVKPIVIAARLFLNVFVGEKLHHALGEMHYGFLFLTVINCCKICMYCLQAYLFYVFMFAIYEHTCISHEEHK